jgi:alanine dehydrogenase
MLVIGLIREGKIPADTRVALTPAQCRWIHKNLTDVRVVVQASENRCYTNSEYERAGVEVKEDLSECDVLFGIKEIPVAMLVEGKKYMIFSHTRKKQPQNAKMLKAMIDKGISLVDYECLVHEDGQRIIGFGFFAGIVGAHNGIMAYGKRTGEFNLGRVYECRDYRQLINTYFGLKLPNVKIAVTGNGRVAHGVLEIMNLMDVREVEPEDFKQQDFTYPVYAHFKGSNLYRHRDGDVYRRDEFHQNPAMYECVFEEYCSHADVLMNGVYWDKNIPQLFSWDTLKRNDFKIKTIADITDDAHGSVPCNLGDGTFEEPVYGVDRLTGEKTAPYLNTSVDIMAVGNLPNELPRDASRYFGEQLIKHVLEDLRKGSSSTIDNATILVNGKLTNKYSYLQNYADNA